MIEKAAGEGQRRQKELMDQTTRAMASLKEKRKQSWPTQSRASENVKRNGRACGAGDGKAPQGKNHASEGRRTHLGCHPTPKTTARS